jgi:hypothetical protein
MAMLSAIMIGLLGALGGCGAAPSEQAPPSLERIVLPSGSTLSADMLGSLAPGEKLYVDFTKGGTLRVDAAAGAIDYERVVVLKTGGAEETLASWLDRTYSANPELVKFRDTVFDLTAPDRTAKIHPNEDVCYHCTCKGPCCAGCRCYPIEC